MESGQGEEEEEEMMGTPQLACFIETCEERDGKQKRCSNPYAHPDSLQSSPSAQRETLIVLINLHCAAAV